MNLRNVLKTYSLLRALSDDETALLNTLRGMNEGERELLIEGLSPEKKLSKKTGDIKKRNLEHCGVCDYTRRAAHHKDANHKDYHEFQSGKPKSQRASSLQQQIQNTTRTVTGRPILCTYEINGKVCHGTENDGIHDATMGYAAYHPFVSPSPARNAGGRSSSRNGPQPAPARDTQETAPSSPSEKHEPGENASSSPVNSEVVTESVSSATGD